MKKLMLTLLAVCAINLHAVNVYVGGVVMDGIDRTPAYWLNGTLHFLSLYEPLPDGTTYGGMAVENGIIYMCVLEGKGSAQKAYIYKDGGEEIGSFRTEGDEITAFAVINGKAYIGIRKYGCTLYKIGGRGQERAGQHIVASNGTLYYTTYAVGDDYYNNSGYYAGAYQYNNDPSWPKYFRAERIRYINGNLYMMGNDRNGACVQTNITRRDHIEGYGKKCKDMAIVNGQYYYIMDDKLINQNGRSILSNLYEPLQIIGYGDYMYILYKSKQGAIPEYYVGVYDPRANRITPYTLPSCVGAYDLYIEN